MASRGKSTLTVELKAVVGQYQSAMRQAGGATDSVEQGLKRVEKAGAGLEPVSVRIRRVGLSATAAEPGTKKLSGGIDRLHKGATGLESGMSGAADGIAGVTTIMEEGASASAGTALAFANIGSAASTAAIPAVKGLGRGLSGLKSLTKGVGSALSGDILGGLARIAKGSGNAASGIGGLIGKIGGLRNVLIGGGLIAGVGALVFGIKALEDAANARRWDEFTAALKRGGSAMQEAVQDEILMAAAFGNLDGLLRRVAQESGIQAAARIVEIAESMGFADSTIGPLRQKLEELNAEFGHGGPLADSWAQAIERQTAALKAHQDALTAQFDPVFAAISASRDAADAVARQTEAQKTLDQAIAEHGPNSAEAAEAQRGLDAAQQGVVESSLRQYSTQQTLAQGLANGTVKVETLEGTLADLEAQGYGASGMAQWLRAKIAELRSKDLYLRAYDLVSDKVGTIRRNLDSLRDKTINIRTVVSYSTPDYQTFGGGYGSSPKKRQHGGPVMVGRMYQVGEDGPELFVPRVSGQIVPSGRMTSAGWTGGSYGTMGGGGGVNVNLGPVTIVANDPQAVAEGLIRHVRRNGAGQIRRALGV